VVFGLASIVVCFRVIVKIEDRDGGEPDELVVRAPPAGQSAFTSGKASTL
jgi:hypothetical protein